jgi:SAM-dependent methyltransferase
MVSTNEIRETVRRRYAVAAVQADSCCGPQGDCGSVFYDRDETGDIPARAVSASLGCGNPIAVADLGEGDTVLDLGSGGGIDVLLSARRVGPEGFVYGIDMTDEMLELARRNAAEAGAANVEFRKGYIEALPLPDESVDVVISNCVINLSTDKPKVFEEIARVLRPGGRLGVSDVVADDSMTELERLDLGNWEACIAGALTRREYRQGLEQAGFVDVSLTPTHDVGDGLASVIIKASKPGGNASM